MRVILEVECYFGTEWKPWEIRNDLNFYDAMEKARLKRGKPDYRWRILCHANLVGLAYSENWRDKPNHSETSPRAVRHSAVQADSTNVFVYNDVALAIVSLILPDDVLYVDDYFTEIGTSALYSDTVKFDGHLNNFRGAFDYDEDALENMPEKGVMKIVANRELWRIDIKPATKGLFSLYYGQEGVDVYADYAEAIIHEAMRHFNFQRRQEIDWYSLAMYPVFNTANGIDSDGEAWDHVRLVGFIDPFTAHRIDEETQPLKQREN